MRRIAIIGGGISGLTAAYEFARVAREGIPIEAVLYEASPRFGGIIETVREGGFTVECGPDGWVSAKPWARELVLELGLADEIVPSNDASRKTWLYLDQRLVAMPDGLNMMVPSSPEALAALDGSPLFTSAAIAAYRAEPGRAAELRATAPTHDESIADFTLRHFGPEILDRVAAPLLSGVFGGDVRTLSARAVMPGFVQMEREHGSLIAALSLQYRKNGHPATPIFTTLRGGLGTLIDRLVSAIPATWLRLNTSVTQLEPPGPGQPRWNVRTSGPVKRVASEGFDAVFLATPLDAARQLLGGLDLQAAQLLPVESSSAVLVAFCFADAARVPIPPGFGFLVPPKLDGAAESATDTTPSLLLACTFADQKFPHRVPPNGRLIRAYFGGTAADRLARCNNDEIAAITRAELARILHSEASISGPVPAPLPIPVLTLVRRWPNSLPQYAVGHLERVAELESRLCALPGLTLLGNSLHGVGIPDLIRDARKAARTTAHITAG